MRPTPTIGIVMEPKDRWQKARRVLAVQAAIERLASWSLADLGHEITRMDERRADLDRFLDGETALGGAFSVAVMRRLQGLAETQATLNAEKDLCAERCREERLRLRCAELIVDALGREARRIDDLRELERVTETSILRARVRPEQG
jgi:hypothetical protein